MIFIPWCLLAPPHSLLPPRVPPIKTCHRLIVPSLASSRSLFGLVREDDVPEIEEVDLWISLRGQRMGGEFRRKVDECGARAREVVPDCLHPDKHWLKACGPW